MFLNIYNLKLLVTISIVCIVIKIIDNVVDNDGYADYDKLFPERGALPYVAITLCISCVLNTEVTVSLIFSAYVIGMFESLNMTFLFKLKGYQECIIVLIIAILFLGLKEMSSSLLIISSIQLIDDLIDIKKDKITSNKNYALKYGVVEVAILAIILFLMSIYISPNKTIVSFLVFGIFQVIENLVIWRMFDETRDN